MLNEAVPQLVLDRISALQAPAPGRAGGLLREISFGLAKGSCLALLGDRQAGGPLLLDVVAGHAAPSSGSIELAGQAVTHRSAAARPLAIVSPRDPLFPHLSVRGNAGFPLRARRMIAGERRRRVEEALALLGLEGLAAARPAGLDPEARVRALLARALAREPQALLLDDPFALLDAQPRRRLQRALRRLVRARNLTVLLATGDRDEALLLGDEIGILQAGRLHQVGSATALLDHPADPVVAERLGDANLLTGRVVATDDEVALVRLSCGHEMEAEPGEPLQEGALCVLCVRPDRIATAFLGRPGVAPEAGSLPASLIDAIHFGDHLRLRFRLADGSEILVRRPPAALVGEMRPDRPALLAWQPHQARVFAAVTT